MMNEEREQRPVFNNMERRASRGRLLAGVFLLVIGGIFLLDQLNMVMFPRWFFRWPLILIAVGLYSGVKEGFRGAFWLIALVVGGMFLLNDIEPGLRMQRFVLPVALMAVGLLFVLRPRHRRWCPPANDRLQNDANNYNTPEQQTAVNYEVSPADVLNITAVFGGVKKKVLSKNFRGGEIMTFMGGSEIDLTQADFNGTVVIDATNIFGGTKLIVPSGWDVQNDVAAVFGGVDDKRQVNSSTTNFNKVLVLNGTCLFGGIEIKNF